LLVAVLVDILHQVVVVLVDFVQLSPQQVAVAHSKHRYPLQQLHKP
jgi:hypothetical protein